MRRLPLILTAGLAVLIAWPAAAAPQTASPVAAQAEKQNFNPGWDRVDAAFMRKDYVEARRIAEELAATGHPEAINGLASFLFQGIGGPVDPERGRALLERAVAGGSMGGKVNLGRLLALQNDKAQWPRAQQLLSEVVDNPQVAQLVYYPLGRVMIFGGRPEDMRPGVDYMIQAAELTLEPDAHYLAGRALGNGWGGIKRDPERSAAFFLKASELGDARARRYVGMARLQGEGLPKDPAAALADFRAAAEQGDTYAMIDVAVMLAIGEGVPADPPAARAWYLKAAEKGSAHALRGLGAMYYDGEGGARDRVTGRAYLELAAAGGDPEAPAINKRLFDGRPDSDRRAIDGIKADWLKTHPQPKAE